MDMKFFTETLKKEISKVIVGKEELTELFTIALLVNGHILLESVPGTGKTMFAKTFSQAIDGDFKRIQFTPDVLPSDVTGIQFFNPKLQQFELRPGPVITNILLADEINRATPRTQSSLLEVMEEFQVTIDGITTKIDRPFMVIATQNPVESQQGTFSLPYAQMDRFFMKVRLDYPTYEEEREIIAIHKGKENQNSVVSVLKKEEILEYMDLVHKVYIQQDVEEYLLAIVRATRNHPDIELGVSPRGTIALLKGVQALALINNRVFVTPSDIKRLVPFILSHRIHLTTEASMRKTPETVLNELLDEIEAPVEANL